jgi:ubiquinol-cytochrome c reductase cytochrome c1 subunit
MNQRKLSSIVILLFGLGVAGFGVAAGAPTTFPMAPMNPDAQNKPSLQNGMKLYVNYCLGCHSMRFQRYSPDSPRHGDLHQSEDR